MKEADMKRQNCTKEYKRGKGKQYMRKENAKYRTNPYNNYLASIDV